jgi:hypothetical protein
MNFNELENYLDEIIEKDPGVFMNMCYGLLVNFPGGLLDDDNIPSEQKREGIRRIITYFETREEYEKCTKLKEVLNTIKD